MAFRRQSWGRVGKGVSGKAEMEELERQDTLHVDIKELQGNGRAWDEELMPKSLMSKEERQGSW